MKSEYKKTCEHCGEEFLFIEKYYSPIIRCNKCGEPMVNNLYSRVLTREIYEPFRESDSDEYNDFKENMKKYCISMGMPHNFTCDSDMINQTLETDTLNPPHYKTRGNIECIQVTELFNFCLGNVIKYVWRAGLKNESTRVEDLKKARWYLDREIFLAENNDEK